MLSQFCSKDTRRHIPTFQRSPGARGCYQDECTCGEALERGLSVSVFVVSDTQPFRELVMIWGCSRSHLFEVQSPSNDCECKILFACTVLSKYDLKAYPKG